MDHSLTENRQKTEGFPYSLQSVDAQCQVLFVPIKYLRLKSQPSEAVPLSSGKGLFKEEGSRCTASPMLPQWKRERTERHNVKDTPARVCCPRLPSTGKSFRMVLRPLLDLAELRKAFSFYIKPSFERHGFGMLS